MKAATPNITWSSLHEIEFQKPYYQKLRAFLETEKKNGKRLYPDEDKRFKAFELCPFQKTKVIILGQDPYHGANQAHGLSFSVPKEIKVPPSLKNIYKELQSDLGIKIASHGNLEAWAKQGVLLLNSTLTVEAKSPASHTGHGWETFTDQMITALSDHKKNLVFILWGKYAQSKASLIDDTKHLILKSPHPSPFSAHTGFLGSAPFSQTNQYLIKHAKAPINWAIE